MTLALGVLEHFRSNCTECLWTTEEASERKGENMATHLIMEIAFGWWQLQFNVTFTLFYFLSILFFSLLDRCALVLMYRSTVFCWLAACFQIKVAHIAARLHCFSLIDFLTLCVCVCASVTRFIILILKNCLWRKLCAKKTSIYFILRYKSSNKIYTIPTLVII